MDFTIPQEIQRKLDELDAFIEREIKPLEDANPQFFDHRREWARTDFENGGRPRREWEELLGEMRRRALGLMRDDRFAEALNLLVARDRVDSRELLLRGVLLAQVGRLAEARDAAHRLIDAGGPHPDAHHLLGLCHELDCAEQAAGQYRLAAYLDPDFAMPRLRMGLLARRRDPRPAPHEEMLRQNTVDVQRAPVITIALEAHDFSR